jgi:catechol 2,3-dioxygenase-like lactoylglutathione lyase family enzyme
MGWRLMCRVCCTLVFGAWIGSWCLAAGQPTPARPRLTGINHVAFRTSDLTSSKNFYGELLGLGVRAAARNAVVYAVGSRQHIRLEPGLPKEESERLSHIAFETPDVDALRLYLLARGVEILQPAGGCDAGAIRVSDPDGHTIEFVQVPWPALTGVEGRRATRSAEALSDRLLHAGVTVRDEQAAHRFYRDVLGFSEIWRGGRTEGVTSWINMRVPDGTDYLEYMLVTATPDRRQLGVLHHVCLLVPDIQIAWETVATRSPSAARAELAAPNVGRNGRWQLNLYDPDGTRTELMEPFTIR